MAKCQFIPKQDGSHVEFASAAGGTGRYSAFNHACVNGHAERRCAPEDAIMFLKINQSNPIPSPTVEVISEALQEAVRCGTRCYVILEDSSDRNLNFVQALATEEWKGLCVECQLNGPRQQFRLRRLATAEEATEIFIGFIGGGMEPRGNPEWRDITEDLFGPTEREIDDPLVL